MILETLSLTNIERFLVYAVTLSLLVLVHEWGHYIVARKCGVGVREFALGFGPILWSWDSPKTGTRYRLNAVPLGGYCAMTGEEAGTKTDSREILGSSYMSVGAWQRLAIVSAGPAVNIVAAFLVLWIAASTLGTPSDKYSTTVGPLTPGGPAEKAGLHPGDRILRIDGHAMTDGKSMIAYIHSKLSQNLSVDYQHGGQSTHVQIQSMTKVIDGKKIGLIGFKPVAEYVRETPIAAGEYAGAKIWEITVSTLDELGKLVHGAPEAVNGISGPIGMARAAVAVQDYGPQLYLSFVALLSLSLGIFNLLPIPALDGGRAIFVIAELLRGRPVDPEKEALVHITGFAALILLVLFVTYRDILHIASGQAAF